MKSKQGISLIVLVITIIVMVILAAAVVITLSNTGIINKANDAVSKTNLKEVEQLASITWAEEFMDGKRGDTLKEAVLSKLSAYTLDYTITVTDKGVTVVKGNGKTLNEYGFYYDVPYKVNYPDDEDYLSWFVFKEDGTSKEYNMNIKSLPDIYTWEYRDNKLVMKFEYSNVEYSISNDGKTLTSLDETYLIKCVYDEEIYRDLYYNKTYYYVGYGRPYKYTMIISADNSIRFYNDEVLEATIPSEKLEKTSHVLTIKDETGLEEIIAVFGNRWRIGMDGRYISPSSGQKRGSWLYYEENEIIIYGHNASYECFYEITTFEEGTTWEEFVNSSYNKYGMRIVGDEIKFKCCEAHDEATLMYMGEFINKNDKVIMGEVYMYTNEK